MSIAREPAAMAGEAGSVGFEQIYEAELAYVWHTLARLGVPEADREDVAHDVFVVVHRKLDDYDRSRPLRPWLFGIAFRVVSDWRRRARHRLELVDAIDAPDDRARTPEALAVARSDRELVHAALARLELTRRAVFILHELDGCSIPEIAQVIDAPPNTLYSHLRRARNDFRDAVRALRPTEETR